MRWNFHSYWSVKPTKPHTLILLCCVFCLQACAPAKQAYLRAYESRSVPALEEFIRDYPDSQFQGPAQAALADIVLTEAKHKNSIEHYKALLARYPQNHKLQRKGRGELAQLEFQQISATPSKSAYRNFIANYPFSRFVPLAKSRIDQLDFDAAKKSDNVEAYEAYIAKSSNEKHKKLAKDRLAEFDFARAKEANSIEAYEDFLRKHWDSSYSSQASERLLNLRLPATLYYSKNGAVTIHWGKVEQLQSAKLTASYGDSQRQSFNLGKDTSICDTSGNLVDNQDLRPDTEVTIATYPERNIKHAVAIFLGTAETKLDESNVSEGGARIVNFPSCFPKQVAGR